MCTNKNINLLPLQYLQKRELRKCIKIMAAIQAAIFLLSILIVSALILTSGTLVRKSAYYDELLRDPSFVRGDLTAATLRAKNTELERLTRIIETIEFKENINSSLILTLANNLPEQMYFRNISIDAVGIVTIKAMAARKALVSDYLAALDGRFRNSSLVSMLVEDGCVYVDLCIEQ